MHESSDGYWDLDDQDFDFRATPYQDEADILLYSLLSRTLPYNSPIRPPAEEIGIQSLELAYKKRKWESVGLIAVPCPKWPEPEEPSIVGSVQFCERPFATTAIQPIHQVDIVVHPDQCLEVVRAFRLIDASASNFDESYEVSTLEPDTIKAMARLITDARVKEVEF